MIEKLINLNLANRLAKEAARAMKTTSINILNLCVPCYNHCRYCLLSWNGKCLGIEYTRSVEYARNFYNWLKIAHPDIKFVYYFGYSMEHPDLPEAIKFMQETNSPGGEFLQFDGMKMRTKAELHELFENIRTLGIKSIDFTFYGTQQYHDRFAGRKGDFELMMNSLEIALEKGINVEVGIPITKENISQIDELISMFPQDKIKIFLFTPHSGGRGIALLDSKITVDDYEGLSVIAKNHFNRNNNKTPLEWLNTELPTVENRVLTLSLLPSNIEHLEQHSFDHTLTALEKMDEDYFGMVPDFQSLLTMYADVNDKSLYSRKDLYMLYRRRYIEDNNLAVSDLTDERFSGSIRY